MFLVDLVQDGGLLEGLERLLQDVLNSLDVDCLDDSSTSYRKCGRHKNTMIKWLGVIIALVD